MNDAPPKIAVSMPAHNAAAFIGAAIESVLAQQDIALELIIVDDGSRDDTAGIAARYAERGVRVLRNPERRGIGYSHNRVIRETSAPLIAHVDADDMIVPGALARMVAALRERPDAGQAYCDFVDVDASGHGSEDARRIARDFFAVHRAAPIDYPRELVVHGMVVSALRTYRRTVFDVVGPFDEALPWAVDYDMALRIAERFTFVHVPELLYLRRVHGGGTSQRVPRRDWSQWAMRRRLVRRRLAAGGGRLFGHGAITTHLRLLLGLGYVARGAASSVRMFS